MAARKRAVREPVQVYLTATDRSLLREVALAAGVSGAEVLRRGLRRMAGDVLGNRNPALRMLEEMNAADWPADLPSDAAAAHDHHLAESFGHRPKKRTRR